MPLDWSKHYDKLSDPLWRLSNLYWITDKAGQRVLFQPNDAQRDFIENRNGRDIILKSRQLGFTTLSCLIALDLCLFVPDTRAAIIAHKLTDAQIIFRDKVKYPYDNLPDDLRAALPLLRDSADELMIGNNSSLRVSTSVRSGTLQYLHVSEFGKICATNPAKALEIVTGSFPAVADGGRLVIESTAEGQSGEFYRLSTEARALDEAGTPLAPDDFKFHFFPWHEAAEYVADPTHARISAEDEKYFEKLKAEHDIDLTLEQMAWYVSKERTLGGNMSREYPSTPDEAFEQAIEGAYFSQQMASANKQGRIGDFPAQSNLPVHTFWDLGKNDCTAIWFMQLVGGRRRMVGYYENSGESIAHYITYVREWLRERELIAGDHYWPHDGRRGDLFYEENQTRLTIAAGHGMRPRIVERVGAKMDAIDAARAILPSCDFDARGCICTVGKLKVSGIQRLREYRKEWDKVRGVFRDNPAHNEASHGADGFMTMATGYTAPVVRQDARPRVRGV